MTVKAQKKKSNMERRPKSSAFQMKAGKEGPMKKNFPSAFKDNGDPFTPDPKSKNFVAREIKSAKGEEEAKNLKGQARVKAFEQRHGVTYKLGVNTAGTVEEGRGQKMFVDEKGRSMEMNERSYLAPL